MTRLVLIATLVPLLLIAQDADKPATKDRRPSAPRPEKIDARTGDVPVEDLETKEETYPGTDQTYRTYTFYIASNRTQVKHGGYVEFYPGGKKKREVTYVHGQPNGRQRWWHNNGMVWMDFSTKMGKRHGTYQEYGRNGKIRKRVRYLDGKITKK